MTAEELRNVTGDQRADPDDVHTSFLAAVRRSPWEINNRALSAFWLDRGDEWIGNDPPPFIVYLVLTCLIASATDEEVHGEGDFRERLRILLQHPAGTSYPLEDLPRLWKALSGWLDRQRGAGLPLRELILPHPGWMTRIGYSVRLAFPERKDQLRLIRLLAPHNFSLNPPIPLVLNLVGGCLDSFSEPFQEAFATFRRAFVRSDNRLVENPFWSAVREAVTAKLPEVGRPGAAFQLFLESTEEWQEELVLMADSEPTSSTTGVQFVPTGIDVGDFKYVVTAGGDGDAAKRAVSLLLHGVLGRAIPDLRFSAVLIAAEQGVLLFRRRDSGARELAISRPDDDEVWALIREDLSSAFTAIFPPERRPSTELSPYPGWLTTPVFEGGLLDRFDHASPGPLQGIRCLQPTAAGIRLQIAGGVPLPGAYLGLPLCLPTVKVRDAEAVELLSVGGASGPGPKERLSLRRSPESLDVFEFPDGGEIRLDGRYNLRATAGKSLVAQRQITFRTDVLWQGYSRPSAPQGWMAESTLPDVVVPLDGAETPEVYSDALTASEGGDGDIRATVRVLGGDRRNAGDRMNMAQPLTIPLTGTGMACFEPNEDGARRVDRFIECCAGWAASRKGIPEPDFLDWIQRALAIDEYALKFDVSRAWIEAGYFDCLLQRRWRGRVYFARDPELVISKLGTRVRGTLRGLAPRSIRNRIESSMAQYGAARLATTSRSRWVPAPSAWSAESAVVFERVAAECRLGPVRAVRPTAAFLASVGALAAGDVEVPINYVVRGTWDWRRGFFTPAPGPGDNSVEIQWLWRTDRPACYQVLNNGELQWVSYSRNWALLFAHTLAGVSPFELAGEADLIRAVQGQVYLPAPLVRYLSATADCSAGPAATYDGGTTYAYSFSGNADRARTLALLWGTQAGADRESIARQLRWVMAISLNRDNSLAVPLPGDLRRALGGADCPDARRLASMAVPVFLIPHIRQLVDE